MSTTVDREKDCPFLLRLFCKVGSHHPIGEFDLKRVPSKDELQLYTWRNATLEEIAQLIMDVYPEAQLPDARLSFRLVYLDSQRATYTYKDIGRVAFGGKNANPQDHQKTLETTRFMIGDYIDVAIFDGPPPPRSQFRNSGGPTRGFGGGGRDRSDRGGFGGGPRARNGHGGGGRGGGGFGRRERF
ncbi:Sin3 associated polypeptide p18-domain-containing protein [Umbelopsis sp. AD052]|nr:Sin3 associated polypeptide p18-domain-containing protein [Umbelopsis sp. AD052]